jgi:hypothetical protein
LDGFALSLLSSKRWLGWLRRFNFQTALSFRHSGTRRKARARNPYSQTGPFFFVMPGLEPGIHRLAKEMDRRIKSGDDDGASQRSACPVFCGSGAPSHFSFLG